MKKYELDMINGPLLKSILLFSVPLMLSSLLQLLFNAADIVVVGQFSGPQALAAVGGTSSIVFLLTALLNGLSVGTNVVVARFVGQGDPRKIHDSVHTSMMMAIIGGLIITIIGESLARPMLSMMSTPDNVIDLATLYLRIYFLGTVSIAVYNFGAAILRSKGDTQRPLYYLFAAGIINVGLNLFFVIVCGMSVDGVAIATIISQTVSAILILITLIKEEGPMQLHAKELRFNRFAAIEIIRIGLPASIQSMVFSFSNIIIQSSINSFGDIVMAGNSAAANIESFVYISCNAFFQACMTFTGQNVGAGNNKRINTIFIQCLILVTVAGFATGGAAYLFRDFFLSLYSSDPAVIAAGNDRMLYVVLLCSLNGILDVIVGSMRGMGYSTIPTIITIAGITGVRLIWIATVFQMWTTLPGLYLCFPVSWIVTSLFQMVCWFYVRNHLEKHTLQPA